MKKLLGSILGIGLIFLMAGCSSSTPQVGPTGPQGVPGEKGDTGATGPTGPTGTKGEDGTDGHTPEITVGYNGNWFVDGVDTNTKAQGEDGVSVSKIEKTGTDGLVDTYTITLSNGNTSTFTVTNGKDVDVDTKCTIKWLNYDGTVLETDEDVNYPIVPSYDGSEPRRPSDTEGFFTFSGWTLGTNKTTERTYVATYTKHNYIFYHENRYDRNYFEIDKLLVMYYHDAYHIVVPNFDESKQIKINFNDHASVDKLEKLEFSEGLTDIEVNIEEAYNFKYLILPNTVEKVHIGIGRDHIPDIIYNELNGGYYLGNDSTPYLYLSHINSNETSFEISNQCKFLDTDDNSEYNYTITSITIPSTVKSIKYSCLTYCRVLTTITYAGTVEEWNAIEKSGSWDSNIPATEVVCSNGNVSLV